MVILSAALRGIPEETIEAAVIDGASGFQIFFKIMIPQIWGTIAVVWTTITILVLKVFDIVYAMTQGGPGNATLLFQVQAYLDFFKNFNVGRSAAMLMILWLIANLLSTQFIKHWLRLRERARGAS